MRSVGWILLIVISIGTSAPALSDESGQCEPGVGETVARRVQARYEGIRDLGAAFIQTSKSATFGGKPLMASDPKTGRVVFAKPGKMRWTYETPEKSVVVSNGGTLWIYDVAGASVTRLAVTSGFLSGAALQFLLGDGQILESFDVRAANCEPGQVQLELTPKSDATYERLGLLVESETGDILATSVLDLFGNRTRIEFSGVETNRAPKDEVFEFEVPEGVELIEYESAPTG